MEGDFVIVLIAQLCPTLCDPMDYSQPASSVCGILQARILEWLAIPFSPTKHLFFLKTVVPMAPWKLLAPCMGQAEVAYSLPDSGYQQAGLPCPVMRA